MNETANPNDGVDEVELDREKYFVNIALKNDLVTMEQVREAREIQLKIEGLGVKPKDLGEILLEKGHIAEDDYLRIQTKINTLRSAVRISGYKLLEKLGQGSMGTVYKAHQVSLDRVVAVKILAPFLQQNKKFVTRFVREAKVLARLNHANIVQCIDVGVSNGQYYLAMEFCDGPTVLDLIRRGGAMDEARAVRVILQMAQALEHAYDHSILHRDIKPDNIMIVHGGIAKLCDLGLVKDLEGSGDSTDAGNTMGTPNYISPEQARGDDLVDARSDIYSLGASFYHMVTGCTPFDATNPAVVMVSHINEMPPNPRQRKSDLERETERIIQKMMRKNPNDRFQNPQELIADLEKLLAKLSGVSGRVVVKTRKRKRR